MNHYPQFSKTSVEIMLKWLPRFASGELDKAHDYYLKTGQDIPQVLNFCRDIANSGFILIFDWAEWKKQFQKQPIDQGFIDHADLESLRKTLTTYVRQDRFCGGSMADKCSSGFIQSVLQRLQQIDQSI
ncbi:MAG: DUF6508 domain-containing protein [Phycisphaeraceae bacterium]